MNTLHDEKRLIGRAIRDNYLIDDVRASVEATGLTSAAHQVIWAAILDLYDAGKPVDLVILHEALKSRSQLGEAVGAAYLSELYDAAGRPSSDPKAGAGAAGGTDLRDLFAAHALAGLLAGRSKRWEPHPHLEAWMAYWHADAMLEHRAGKKVGWSGYWRGLEEEALRLLDRVREARDEEAREQETWTRRGRFTDPPPCPPDDLVATLLAKGMPAAARKVAEDSKVGPSAVVKAEGGDSL